MINGEGAASQPCKHPLFCRRETLLNSAGCLLSLIQKGNVMAIRNPAAKPGDWFEYIDFSDLCAVCGCYAGTHHGKDAYCPNNNVVIKKGQHAYLGTKFLPKLNTTISFPAPLPPSVGQHFITAPRLLKKLDEIDFAYKKTAKPLSRECPCGIVRQ